jgi:LPPG:FO 2-phospho-L-lactate transferase
MRRIVAISGGVGGAKLVLGLAAVLEPEQLLVVANTGDDFEHLGLTVCPDIDTIVYTLSGFADPDRGWGVAGESWHCLEALERLGGPGWFRIGDRDLAMHLQRSLLLRQGLTLGEVTARLAGRLGVRHGVVPMSDDPLRTIVETDAGELGFQQYFVRERCAPSVRQIRFEGADSARPSPGIGRFFAASPPAAVVICPSNPYLSVDPVLAVSGMRELIRSVPTVAVSPIVGGKAIKGPAAKLMRELGFEASVEQVARHYKGVVDALVIDEADADSAQAIRAMGIEVLVTRTVMTDLEDKRRLAVDVLRLLEGLRS